MQTFVFWIWSALTSLCEALGAPPRVAVGVGLFLLAGVIAGVVAPATATVMTHTRDRIMVRQQARRWTGRKPHRAEWTLINRTHGIHGLSPLMRVIAYAVPVVVGFAFASGSNDSYVDSWADSGTEKAFSDLVLFADRSHTDTGFIVVFGGLGIAAVLLAYLAARITTSWRLARPRLSYAPTGYAIVCALGLLASLTATSPLLLAYAAAYLGWVVVVALVVAVGKAPKVFVAGLLDTSEREAAHSGAPESPHTGYTQPSPNPPYYQPAPPPAPTGGQPPHGPPPEPVAAPVPAGGTRAMPTDHALDSPGRAVVTASTPMLRCEPPHPGDPATIGAYRVHGRLGSGAMGTVFLATSERAGQVALKVLAPALAGDDDSRRRFFREMHALRHIDSPRVVGVVDSGVAGDTPYIAMTAIEGPDLGSHVRDTKPLETDGLSSLARGLAEGLAAVHVHGLVHRDVKPSNIIWSNDGPCLVDFGLAHLGDQTRVTSTGLVIGSPSYVSPERLRGTTATAASDVWNWAACLAFAASGENLYRSDDPIALWHRILNHDYDPAALARLNELGPGVFALAEQCLATEPTDRPRDGAELLRRYNAAAA